MSWLEKVGLRRSLIGRESFSKLKTDVPTLVFRRLAHPYPAGRTGQFDHRFLQSICSSGSGPCLAQGIRSFRASSDARYPLRATSKFDCTAQPGDSGGRAVTSRRRVLHVLPQKSLPQYEISCREIAMPQSKMINERAFEYYHRLREIRRFIEQHYMEEISLKKAARIAGLERKYFSAFFHTKVGVGFKHWLTHMRVGRAMDLMKTEDYTISEVAFSAGFKDVRSFERAFKKYTNRTPRDFKNRVRPS